MSLERLCIDNRPVYRENSLWRESMFRRVLIMLLLSGIILAACSGGEQATDSEAYPSPTSIPPSSDAKDLPYPVDENKPPLNVDPVESDPYPGPGSDEAYAPAPGDEDKIRNNVLTGEANVRRVGGGSNEYLLDISGSLRNPCYELRIVVLPPNEESRIDVDVYAVLSPDSVCTQVLESYEASVSLGKYTGGQYTVWVNGEKIGDIQP